MAVAVMRNGSTRLGPKSFPAPKRASELKYWYKAARKVIPDLPEWSPSLVARSSADVDAIAFHGDGWDLFIARKKTLRA